MIIPNTGRRLIVERAILPVNGSVGEKKGSSGLLKKPDIETMLSFKNRTVRKEKHKDPGKDTCLFLPGILPVQVR